MHEAEKGSGYVVLAFFLVAVLWQVPHGDPVVLQHLGQTPGGSAYNLTYDSVTRRLIVGCGTSVWVYGVPSPTSAELVASRPFRGLVNETIADGNVLFAATTHDGLWALNAASATLDPLAHLPTPGDSAAYDLCRHDSTLYLANGYEALELRYQPAEGFIECSRFGQPNVMTVARRGDIIAIGSRGFLNGTVSVYTMPDLETPVASWTDATLLDIEDVRFADLRDDIIYVCGGTNNLGFTGQFYALQFDGTSLEPVGHYTIGGIPGLANAQIVNMDSRNDTLFLATTAGLHGLETDVPVLDATGLPDDPLTVIGHIRPGLWHFDVALFGDDPYLGIASEWYGVWISDITALAPLDTVAVLPTGGWCQRCYPRGDTLWACMRGYGLDVYDVADLDFGAGFQHDVALLHLAAEFTWDCTFVETSLLWVAHSIYYSVYDLAPWHAGSEPAHLAQFDASNLSSVECIAALQTDCGARVAGGLYDGTIELRDPYAYPDYPLLSATSVGGRPTELVVSGDTLFVGANIASQRSIAAYRVTGDELSLLAYAPAPNTVSRIAKEGGMLAAALGTVGAAWYRFDGSSIVELGRLQSGVCAEDVALHSGLLYVADKLEGLKVFDISDPAQPALVAISPGSGGWQGMFGSTSVSVGPDGRIYLCDFNAGVFVIEPLQQGAVIDWSMVPGDLTIAAFPNPFLGTCRIRVSSGTALEVYDLRGRLVWQEMGALSGPAAISNPLDEGMPHTCTWCPRGDVTPGVYVALSRQPHSTATTRLVYVK